MSQTSPKRHLNLWPALLLVLVLLFIALCAWSVVRARIPGSNPTPDYLHRADSDRGKSANSALLASKG